MNLYIDTCVLPRSQLQTAGIYRERYSTLGMELLMMFDLPDFEENLTQNLDLFRAGPLVFHEPVWGVEHSAPKGSKAWEDGMYHIRLTQKFAEILHPQYMIVHLNNCQVKPGKKEEMLRTALQNLEEMQEMFPGVTFLYENTGTKADGNILLNQSEFTDLCRGRGFPVLIDIGHANANGWDIRKLIRDLQGQIRGFHLHNNDGVHDFHNRIEDGTIDYASIVPYLDEMVPDAFRVIEYTRPACHGGPLLEDIEKVISYSAKPKYDEKAATAGAMTDPTPAALGIMRMQYILANMDDAVCLTASNGELIYANAAAERLFSIRADQHIKIWNAIPYEAANDALIQLFIDSVMEKKQSIRSQVDYVNNKGKAFRLHVTLTCESGENGNILFVITNLTELLKVQSAFERYTSPEIAGYVLGDPEGGKQGGQERDVSILMSDLRGFTAMSTRLSSTDLITELNHYFEAMSAVIRRYNGTVIEFLGDGIFVVFGAPEDVPDHATAAVSCAVEMQNALEEVNAWNREQGYPELQMGIGISTGKCVVGNIGSNQKMKYGCMGETVNLAGRLESFCIGGEIHILETTRQRISEELTIIGENSFMPKGGRAELKSYNITGIGKRHMKLESEDEREWLNLPGEETTFFLLSGKAVDPIPHTGRLTKVTADEKHAILETDAELKSLQDLMIRIGEKDAYAKVAGPEENGYMIGFTMKQGSLTGGVV